MKVEELGKLLQKHSPNLRLAEIRRGERAKSFLAEGAPAFQKKDLPPVYCKNAASALENAPMLTDTIASWVKEKIVAGPFMNPPLGRFRCNSLMTVRRNGKVRPVLNVSSPAGSSLNDNVTEAGPERVEMSSTKQFGSSILTAGRHAVMSKFDTKNAYKIVPCKIRDLRLQGFKWGERYFVETALIFGAKTSVSNYDTV